ncbi:hypothetical protein [Rhizobium tumorigenes]|uniref:Uncharacterized protein n=1 Tax=Rhizobium tumorigenes TaxID=2041385 RepID=A0AAF1KVF2_9HYPH|nr:hypothetical protein [Rhizobium tumorigenes]WFR94029.1 hypothetical protein PR017_09210 [Rhizobium tumorigenes]
MHLLPPSTQKNQNPDGNYPLGIRALDPWQEAPSIFLILDITSAGASDRQHATTAIRERRRVTVDALPARLEIHADQPETDDAADIIVRRINDFVREIATLAFAPVLNCVKGREVELSIPDWSRK